MNSLLVFVKSLVVLNGRWLIPVNVLNNIFVYNAWLVILTLTHTFSSWWRITSRIFIDARFGTRLLSGWS